jgi:hypothetical protein
MYTAVRIVVFFQTSNFASPSPAEGIQYQSLQRRRHHQIFRNLLFLGMLCSVAVLSYLYFLRGSGMISENKNSEVSLLLALIDVENIERFDFYKKQRPKREVSEPEVLESDGVFFLFGGLMVRRSACGVNEPLFLKEVETISA